MSESSVAMFDILSLSIIGGIGVLVACGIGFWSVKRYEIAVLLMAISPWIYAVSSYYGSENLVEDQVTAGSYIRIGLLVLIGSVGVLKYLLNLKMGPEKLPLEMKLFGGFLLFALMSTSYSVDPVYTFIRSASFIAFFGFLLGLHSWMRSDYEMLRTLDILFYLSAAFAVVNASSPLILGDLAWVGDEVVRFRGWAGHPNMLGGFCMVSYPIVYWKYLRSDVGMKLVICGLVTILAGLHFNSGSRATLLLAFVGMFMWFVVSKRKVSLVAILGILTVAVVWIGSTTSITKNFQRETEQGMSITTLTGRGELWAVSYKLMTERPILGYGYGVAGKVLSDARFYEKDITIWSGSVRSSLHNGYLSTVLGVGVVAFIFWLSLLLMPFWRCRLAPWSDYKGIVMTVMLMGVALSFVESSPTGCASPEAIIFWSIWIMAEKCHKIRGERNVEEGKGLV
jgi:O-antigen ligase